MDTRSARLSVAFALAITACGGSAPATQSGDRPEATLASFVAESSSVALRTPLVTSTTGPPTTATAEPFTAVNPTSAPEPGTAPIGQTEVARVLSITDGDTIRIDRGRGSEALRYIGMNAPEPAQAGGAAATAANAALVKGREIVLERDVSNVDQYHRLLRYVWLREGSTWTLVNLELINEGVAKAATYPPDVRYKALFIAAQSAAQDAGVGVWGFVSQPTRPPAAGSNCHSSYDPCLPIVADMSCPEVRAMGVAPVHVIGPDDYRLDADHDGLGCE